jgi:hypothetical protein
MNKINMFITSKGAELNRRFNSGSCHHFIFDLGFFSGFPDASKNAKY